MALDRPVADFAADVGADDPVTVTGAGTRGGPVPGVRAVVAPSGLVEVEPAEMIVTCGAATPVELLLRTLAEHGQTVGLPGGGTVGGALAVGHSDHRRLRHGPLRDALLQARFVNAGGEVVKAGGPTVKNVSGFDLCRLLVGSRGSLGFVAEVTLRTRPLPPHAQWFTSSDRAFDLLARVYRPSTVLWDGRTTWVLLEGHRLDVERQAAVHGLEPASAPEFPPVRSSHPPAALAALLAERPPGSFVAEVGVGVVHSAGTVILAGAAVERPVDPAVRRLHRRIKQRFDPDGRLNPGVDPLVPSPPVVDATSR